MEQREETNAVRLYGQNDTVEDFPVLKAFQQYIDAEQTKARRRIVWLSIVFGFTTIGLVALFLFIISVISSKYEDRMLTFSNKNQELNDRLVEYAMKDRDKPRPQSDEGNKAALDVMKNAMTALQNQLAEQQKLLANEQRRNSEIVAAQAEGRAKIDAEREANEKARRANEAALRDNEAKMRENEAKIEKIRALLAAEKDKLAAEREKLKNEAKELHRQRLYPEYYAKKEASQQQQPAPAAKPQPKPQPAEKPAPAAKPLAAQPPAAPQTSLPAKKRKDGAIRYFDSDDDVEDSDSDSLWVIPE